MIIMTWKVDPCTEGGADILIKESSIKAIDSQLRPKKSSTDTKVKLRFSYSFVSLDLNRIE
jgi:hypothetical protein